MVDRPGKLDERIIELAEMTGEHLDAHPDISLLADYLDGLIPDKESDLVREHLALCKKCTQACLSLEDGPLVLDHEGVDHEDADSSGLAIDVPGAPSRFWNSPKIAWANAAVFLIGFILSLMYAFQQHSRLMEINAPSQTFLLELSPLASHVKSGNHEAESVVPVGNKISILLDAIGIEIKDGFYLVLRREGNILKTMPLTVIPPDGFISMVIPKNLAPGCYHIDLKNELAEPKASYTWCIE